MVKIITLLVSLYVAQVWAMEGVSQATLKNGLKIIVKTDNRAPVFISQLWYKVGASNEKRPLTGVSHMLEHMMFKGTDNYKTGEFSKIIARNGGDENAFTSNDYTAYYQKMHKSKLALALKMEADRMRHLQLSNDEFEKERQVVIEERRLRIEDNPNANVAEHLNLISFAKKSAYHSPVIGFKKDIENYKLSDLRTWYETYYAPNNATLVVVGDVDAKAVIALAQQYFGGYKANANIGNIDDNPSITQTGQSHVLKLKAKLPFSILSFPVPSLKTASDKHSAYALDMLAYVLDNGLSKTLVRDQQIASSIGVGYGLYSKYDTLLTLSFIPAKGVSNEAVLSAIKMQVAELIKKPAMIKEELLRTKIQLEASFVFEQDHISTQSYYLGMLATVGLPIETLFSYVDKMRAVSAEDVAQVAKQYLHFSAANSVQLIPQGD
ncbi:FIG015547: peptidase, M16 family [uncultured Gammaproteobacteria bacterium]|jgi:zinc protease|nr:FIG015547: peptidase, M16 family [uncultured Gammaproteobacteria bacterium]CAC9565817.1 FIG015547: peptidase, M16 family [uncultured Gammaproteobacteria bacterium]CAC9575699.1 FIG015547: peptidase, M16 family [uncultured Gammaproteobacteria bacterium]CAC9586794.1 FIG015547: peptidase, M16 family [uncultured Gammaproteobacteria bacterium]